MNPSAAGSQLWNGYLFSVELYDAHLPIWIVQHKVIDLHYIVY